MKCPTPEQLAAYQPEALSSREGEEMRVHLTACETCRRELAALQETQRVLETMPAPAMPDDLWQGVAARIQSTPHRAPFGWWWKPAAGFGGAAAILLGVLFTQMASPSLPVAEASAGSYVTDHQFLSAGDPFADRAGLGVMLAAQRGETP